MPGPCRTPSGRPERRPELRAAAMITRQQTVRGPYRFADHADACEFHCSSTFLIAAFALSPKKDPGDARPSAR